MRLTAFATATVAVLVLLAAGCSGNRDAWVFTDSVFTYTKADVSEAELLQHERLMRASPGMHHVRGELGADKTAVLRINVDPAQDIVARERLLKLGYVRRWN